LDAERLDEFCPMQPAAESLIQQSMEKLHLSARACHRMIKLSRTLADLDGEQIISASHVAQAAAFRHFAVRSLTA
jgi:magnesium chelatase family protein